MKKTFSIFIFIMAFSLNASEIDSYTQRFDPIADSTNYLNGLVNNKLRAAGEWANSIEGCSKNRLYNAVKFQFTGSILGELEKYINASEEVDKRVIARKNSIYQDFGVLEGSALYFYGLGSIVKLGDNIVGADKFGHFFSEGWNCFDKSVLQKEDLISVLKFGDHSERGFFGWMMTGVYSYADLAVNFNGLRFWVHLADDQRVFTRNYGLRSQESYFSCKGGLWVQSRSFDWSDYVDASWDEGINCNMYPKLSMEDDVNRRIASAMPYASGISKSCPIITQRCDELKSKYGPLGRYFLHPRCLESYKRLTSR